MGSAAFRISISSITSFIPTQAGPHTFMQVEAGAGTWEGIMPGSPQLEAFKDIWMDHQLLSQPFKPQGGQI